MSSIRNVPKCANQFWFWNPNLFPEDNFILAEQHLSDLQYVQLMALFNELSQSLDLLVAADKLADMIETNKLCMWG